MGDTPESIQTGVDRLLELVNKQHKITVSVAAKQLQVPKHVVEHWSDTLEEAGLVATQLTLRERLLLAADCQKKTGISTVLQGFIPFSDGAQFHQERALAEREKAIEKRLQLLNQQLKELERYKALRNDVEAARKQLHRDRKEFLAIRKQLDKEQTSLEKERGRLSEERIEQAAREARLLEQKQAQEQRSKELDMKENVVETRRRELDSITSRLLKVAGAGRGEYPWT